MRLTSSAAIVVLLAAMGCGGAEDSFTEDYNRAVRPIRALGAEMGTDARDFALLARRTAQTRDNLARLDPPEGARDELEALLARLDAVTSDLGAVARATRSKDPVRQRRAARRLVGTSEAVERAESALRRAVEG